MTLVLEIEFLSGSSVAALHPDSEAPDWPPQPDRVFSALVATWAYRGQRPEERLALEWLEALEPPRIEATSAFQRTSYVTYVPPNDRSAVKMRRASDNISDYRSRQPRRFITVRPVSPTVRLLWHGVGADGETERWVSALDALARDTAYVGHSSSLTRCRVYLTDKPVPDHAQEPLRRVYAGRMAELIRSFEAGRRPRVGEWVLPRAKTATRGEPASLFSTTWLVLEHVGGLMPDIRAAALVSQAIRDRVVEGYRAIGAPVSEVVSGRTVHGEPAHEAHLAIVPLPFAGFSHADGRVLGFALVPPRQVDLLRNETWLRALRAICPVDERRGRRVLRVKLDMGEMELSPTLQPTKRSLDPALYVASSSRIFATVTPMVLNRHVKSGRAPSVLEVMDEVARACAHVGLPRLEEIRVEGLDRPVPVVLATDHSAFEGVPSVLRSRKRPAWLRWQVPPYLQGRPITHAIIQFAEPVSGPVILGAGRYLGLGLCRPLPDGGESSEHALGSL
ncbi:type I-G CRISPR-associated protein Csb2 [Alicyclobacillus vulcanalis]|uniref:CRISPR-associated protein Csb2 n=1 Tax=Alicyclobacillus vulcanalis TaxID=252246 RepID=A0A1N7LKR9_9BACL|nr:type I-U CRISPR-associated protein Csb2 [Alicyclobacillus vulcanalis]SIS74402.1 CRISPR-associated protein Csb2 [Alicyclobacillus vulcanalis]